MNPVSFAARKIARGILLPGVLLLHAASAQTVVPVGSGSYASSVPAAEATTDSYYALPQNQVAQFFNFLHIDPALAGKPIPTNHWWSDLIIGNRSYLPADANQYVLQQDLYGGSQWFIPGKLDPQSYGLDVYYANAWKAPNANGTQASIDGGSALKVKGDIPYGFPPEDTLIADFEGGYPAGSTITGNAFVTPPSQGPGLTGIIGTRLASTRDAPGGNAAQGKLSLPSFTVNKHYLHFLMCGGSTADTQVRLVIDGTPVLAASGANSTTLAWVSWDLTPYTGQTAHVEIVDATGAAWGFISCDQIFLSDASNPAGRFGGDLSATNVVVTNWGDWNVDFSLPDASGRKLDVTMARGIPFTWTRWTNMKPKLVLGAATTFYNTSGAPITVTGGQFTATMFAMTVGGKNYGVFLPDNTVCTVGGSGATTYLQPQLTGGANNYVVIGYLPAISNLAEFGIYAYARPTDTKISWAWEPQNGCVTTNWNITTVPLKGANQSTIQGWLPHHYRTTTTNFSFQPYTYQTQRGIMKMGIGTSFQIKFPFQGIAPVLPAPSSTGYTNNFLPSRMTTFLTNFKPGGMLGDTYGSGKGLTLCGQYLAIASEMGDTTNFNRLKTALTNALQNWLTYTPGESNGYFARYEDWKALIGWDASYGSQAFNDLHFHYGYFATAAALLGKYDKTFLANYGPMLRLIVKAFANYDRTDLTQPFMRTLDVWEGHSNAGGMSSANGENQESSSEAMNSWAGVYLLGSMLNDSQMTAAGAMGFAMESRAVNEYWQDLYKTNFPPGYTKAGAAMVWSDNYTYGTYFSADPIWIYAIQYVPSAHWNTYLVRDQVATVSAKYQGMWDERTAWAADPTRTPDVLGAYPGNYVFAFQALWDHANTPAMFDDYYAAGKPIATDNTYSGDTYYLIHAMRQIGDPDPAYSADIPTSAIYYNSGTGARTAVIYNPSPAATTASIYKNGVLVQAIPVGGYAQVVTPVINSAAPLITSAGSANGDIGVAFNYQITATNSPTSYSMTGTLPANLTLDTSTGLISGSPTANGTANVTVFATNGSGSGSKALTITIGPVIPAPVINSPLTAAATVGAAFSYQIAATNSPTSFDATGLPDGLTVNASGLISGTPTAAGLTSINLSATNSTGTGTATLALTASYSGSDTNLALNQPATALSFENATNAVARGNDGNGTTRWAASSAVFPQWWMVDLGAVKSLSRVEIDWYSAASRSSKYKIEVSTDGANFSTVADKTANTTVGNTVDPFTASGRYVRVTITGTSAGFASAYEFRVYGHTPTVDAPVITSANDASGTVGVPFSYQITADNTPTSFSATGLPSGLTVNAAGLISGTPTAAGTSNVTLHATNAGGTDNEPLTISITAPAPDENIAANKTVTASSEQAANPASAATDGAMTRWSAADQAFPQWARIDLGTAKTLSKVAIDWYSAASRAYKYKLEISTDGTNFTTVADKTGNAKFGNTTDAVAATGRYLRVTVTGCSAAGALASAYEIRVFGH